MDGSPRMVWYVLIRENQQVPEVCGCGCGQKLSKEEQENNRNIPILVHWDRAQLPNSKGYHIVEVERKT